ncbi:RES family NAD+ phosphorylase [Pseudopedobacter beijingensis]|uniref:RES family NAD+ phosphorylase n=1 Tax=Pseudopedobacter beijingensis TaxID=1207056 RepID=A0ABW4I7J2_9SPHI
MLLFRLTRKRYADDLSGTGARLNGGRWNSIGTPMVYLASSKSLAVLEVLVHLPFELIPEDFYMATYHVPQQEILETETEKLPANWKDIPHQNSTKNLGDMFIKDSKYFLYKVPSIIVNDEYNFLLNPHHPLVKEVKLEKLESFIFDTRLKG